MEAPGLDDPVDGGRIALNFAYGSNLLGRRLRERVPSARALAVARLYGYRLAWHKRGRDGSGKCDVVATGRVNDCVWGVIYALDVAQRSLLDAAEGLGAGYVHHRVEVVTNVGRMRAFAYRATDVDASLAPYDWYHRLVLAGAREHELPHAYCAALLTCPTVRDSDAGRAAQHTRLLRAA